MSFQRSSSFGIEYNSSTSSANEKFPWLIALGIVFVLVGVAFVVHKMMDTNPTPPKEPPSASAPSEPLATEKAPERVSAVYHGDTAGRPAIVKTLLDRLATAEANKDVEMAIDTIERLRGLPGSPVGDLDNALAKRLGVLNCKKLFEMKSLQWVREVTVRRGENAARIAKEHGATYASTLKLNEGRDLMTIKPGDKILVMNHPRFNLVVHAQLAYADLFLQGKFFKRYYLIGLTTSESGIGDSGSNLQKPSSTLTNLKDSKVTLKTLPLTVADRGELTSLLPANATLLVSEF